MPHQNPNGLVGLVVIESNAQSDRRAVDLAAHDATLAAVLRWLARGPRTVGGHASEPIAGRDRFADDAVSMAADCRALDVELAHAAADLRDQLAAA